ncbi:MAG: DNA polymerase III subunit delta' [Propionibacteriaceae bacterium]|nr:DNA polymerase III subunit delta' [Propionibacteriaceae bacterium]
MSVWDCLVGQPKVVATLSKAATDTQSMTHAWLFTGPPGSGRSVAARAFAAALQCDQGGCNTCHSCTTVLAGTHPDVTIIRTEKLSIGVDVVRDLVRKAVMSPTQRQWQIIIVEDADRITDQGANALLKGIEEPAKRTVWMLCTPTANDVLATIRSRCRQVSLVTPSPSSITTILEAEGIPSKKAHFAADVCQGHIGRARAIATDSEVAKRRKEILSIPSRLGTLGGCLEAAAWIVSTAQEQASAATKDIDAEENLQLRTALGVEKGKALPRGAATPLKDLEEQQGLRAKRYARDQLDSVLIALTSYYRDVLMVQTGNPSTVVNTDFRTAIEKTAHDSTPEATIRKIDAIADCGQALAGNVAPQLACEAMAVTLGM